MDEGTSKTIPLRRTRARSLTVRTPGWTERVTTGVRRVLEPPHQIWLAGLGVPALALRGVREAWNRLVAEGAAAEASIVRILSRTPSPSTPTRETATQ